MIKQLKFANSPSRLATEQDVKTFEAKFGMKLPDVFIEFCRRFNGGHPSSDNSCYFVPKRYRRFHAEYASGDGSVIADGLFGLSSEIKGCDLATSVRRIRSVASTNVVPISFDLLGNHVVVRPDEPAGQVYWFDHELWESPSEPLLFPIAPDLESFYNDLTKSD